MSIRPIARLLLVAGLLLATPAQALIRLDYDSEKMAVRYGLENKDYSYSTFLGGNWREGESGSLLNLYTPFMQVASRYLHATQSGNPSDEDIQKTIDKQRAALNKIKKENLVKFIVSFYGDAPSFARKYDGFIDVTNAEGRVIQRIFPNQSVRQYYGQKEETGAHQPYSAINTYMFQFDDLAKLKRYTFTMVDKTKGSTRPPVRFAIDNEKIY